MSNEPESLSSSPRSLCECRAEGHSPHKGRTRFVTVDINAQPSGHGSYTATATIRVCVAHAKWFLRGNHLNAWPRA